MTICSRPLAGALLAALIAACAASPTLAFDFDDLKTLERAEQDELLAKARQAASSWNFSGARSYLDQARQKGYAPKQVKAVEALIASNESAKEEKDRREEEQRQARLAEEAADRRRASASSSGGGSSGSGGSASSGESVYECKLVCRTSGFVVYETRDMGTVRIKAYRGGIFDKLNDICHGIRGKDSWYHSSDTCPR
ncbi:MAG: hypothetical protein Q8Q28_00975 [Pseudomonadota bacterium]|nr:hypothetical protein [Pseudomonadota bacterium]